VIESVIILILILIIFNLITTRIKVKDDAKQIYSKQLDILQLEVNLLRENKINPTEVISITEHDRMKKEYDFKLNLFKDEYEQVSAELNTQMEQNSKLVSQRQSNHVKLGKVAENFYPLLSDFPYDSKKCVAMLAPIDLLYFGEDEIVFIEIKSGSSSLSPKQRNIKKLIEDGKVSFETHKIKDTGITVK